MRNRALWRLWRELRPHTRAVVGIMASALVGIAAASAVPTIFQKAIDGPVAHGDRTGLWHLALLGGFLAVLESTLAWQRRNRLAIVATDVETRLRDRLYAKLQALDVGFHDQWQSGQLVQRCIGDLSTIRRFVGFGSIFMVILSVQILFVFALIARLDLGLAGLTAVTALPLIFLTRMLERRYQAVSRKVQDLEGDLATAVEEAATGLRAIKAFGRRPYVLDQFEADARRVYDAKLNRVRHRTHFNWVLSFLPNLTITMVLLLGALAVGNGSLTLGGLVAFVFYVLMLRWPLEALGWILTSAEEAGTAAERLFEVLDTEPTIVDRQTATPLTRVAGRVGFGGVTFSYPAAPGDHVLDGVDLTIEPGETVALVGATGSGKTTLALLLPRLYDVTGGSVTIDGLDVRDLRLPHLRAQIGMAFEDSTLFSMSVRENLLLGKPDGDDDDIWEALEIAHAAEFVRQLPWGLDTRIGEQGMSLSGGQRQRVALARAVIGRPPILVLDDPLSALDVHTEAAVEAALASVLQQATALVVVHRPSTVALADRAALLWEGRIAATGTHAELMANDDRYRSILAAEADDYTTSADAVAGGSR